MVARSSSGSGCTASEDRPSGARLVVRTLTSRVVDTSARTSAATPRTTCSQLSSTSRAGPGPRAATIPVSASAGARDVGVPADAGQRHEVHDAVFGVPGDGTREARLAEPAGPDDRGDPGTADQPGHRLDIGVPPEQRVRLVRHPAPHHGRLAAQQFLVQFLEGGPRVGAEFVAQAAPVGVVRRERGGRARGGHLTAHQLEQRLLVERTVGDQLGERRQGLLPAPETGQREGTYPLQRPPSFAEFDPQRPERITEDNSVLFHPTTKQREPFLGLGERAEVIPGARLLRTRGGVQRHRPGVDLVLAEGEPVAAGRTGDDLGAEQRPGPRDQDLQRLRRVLRLRVGPQPATSRPAPHPARGSPASSASSPRSRGAVISFPW
ncbi:hypothetical protein AQJ91_32215 [Streptomyces dysideae]|uniref:Uncharacterized protein n=1 Tax=Streptomyces dysideae TaxID=909626 RepID=A0A101UUQ1_9ACTN|nr:hypothetical protein AQJ91_32215 [Streptomyces dysideae]